MDKYGVQFDDEKTKTAATTSRCPKCGRGLSKMELLEQHCPNCGTQPFEKKPNPSK
jgi:ribosomal protein S27AE